MLSILVLTSIGCNFIADGAGQVADQFRNNQPIVDIGGDRIVITNSTVVIDATDTTDPEQVLQHVKFHSFQH